MTLGFNNCSKVAFEQQKPLASEGEGLGTGDDGPAPVLREASAAIVINGGDAYTRDSLLNLKLNSDGDSMYVTTDSECKSNGEWEDYSPQRTWQADKSNTELEVFVMYRGSESKDSKCVSDTIIHDNIPPTVSIAARPMEYTKNTTVAYEFMATDSGSGVKDILCTAPNKDDFAVCPTRHPLILSQEGTYSINVKSVDKAGNESAVAPDTFVADWTAPTVSITAKPDKLVNVTTAVLKFEGKDNLSGVKRLMCQLPDSSEAVECTEGVVTLTGLKEGEQKFWVMAEDKALNVSDWLPYSWNVDVTGPSVTITSAPRPHDNADNSVFEFIGSDGNKSVDDFECKLNTENEFSECESGKTYTLPEGSYVFEVRAIDEAGNPSEPARYPWMIDRTAPTVTWVTQIPDYISTPLPSAEFLPLDPGGSGIEGRYCILDGVAVDCANNAIDTSDLGEGPHTMTVSVSDRAGNYSEPIDEALTYDATVPQVVIDKGPDRYTNDNDSVFEFRVVNESDPVEFKCTINDMAAESCESPYMKELPEGDYVIRIVAEDASGNQSEPAEHVWTIDTTAPVIAWANDFSEVTKEQSQLARFTVEEKNPIETYACTHNQDPVDCGNQQMLLEDLPDQKHMVSAYVIDQAGNVSNTLHEDWVVDTEKPTIELTGYPKDPTNQVAANFEFRGRDNYSTELKFYCQLNNESVEQCTSVKTYEVAANARHGFSVYVEDEAGNRSDVASHDWYVDQIKPTLEWAYTPPQNINYNQTTLVYTAQDDKGEIVTRECLVNGEPVACNDSNIAASNLIEGTHEVQVIVTDKAGNASDPLIDNFNVDMTRPNIIIVGGPETWTKETSATFELEGTDNMTAKEDLVYWCQLDTGGYGECDPEAMYEGLNESEKIIFTAKVEDLAGNESDPREYEWEIDMSGPQIVILDRPEDHGLGVQDFVHYRVDDSRLDQVEVQCGLNGTLVDCPTEANTDLGTLAAGEYTFQINAQDGLGNPSTSSVTWNVYDLTESFSTSLDVEQSDNKVDILFVVDNSGSMTEEQDELKLRINGFIQEISNLDYQIGVTSTDSWGDTEDEDGNHATFSKGRLRKFGNNKYVLKSTDSLQQQHLGNAVYMGDNGSNTERGIKVTWQFLNRVGNPSNNEAELLRDGADFFVILISDEDEASEGSSAYESQPETLISTAESVLGPDRKFQYNGIIWQPETECSAGEHEGNMYKRLIGMTGGIMGDICANNYTNQLSELGNSVVELVQSVQLQCEPVHSSGTGTPEIAITDGNGDTQTLSYTVNGDRLVFASPLAVGSYTFDYHCLSGGGANRGLAGSNTN